MRGKATRVWGGWRGSQLYEVSGIPRYNRYNSEEETEVSATFNNPHFDFQVLGGGRYWLQNIEFQRYDTRVANVLIEVPAREGTFRLRAANHGYHIWLEQMRADSTWQGQLRLSPGIVADSLVRVHGRNPERSVALPARGLTLRGAWPNCTISLFLRELIRRQQNDTVSYNFEGSAILELRERPK